MNSPATPSTPSALTPATGTPTGTWKHPRIDEINRRQQAKTFNDGHAKLLVSSIGMLIASFIVPQLLPAFFTGWVPTSVMSYSVYAVYLVRLLLLGNIGMALLPFWHRSDDLADIPLTPSQRALLGLKPSSNPITPGSHYITPPRYSRSGTPRSGSGFRAKESASPMSGSPSAVHRENSPSNLLGGSGSPFSPTASPLLQKAVGGIASRRLSFGPSGSALGRDLVNNNTPGSPSPGQKTPSGVSNKWLYERERSSFGRSFGRSGLY